MAYYDYNYFHDKKVAFGWLDITNKITDTTALSLTKNITEYWIQELANYQVEMNASSSIDELLKWAGSIDANYIIVIAMGNHLSKKINIMQAVPEFIETHDITVAGHLLEKKEKYYELHHQFFIVNINWWKEQNSPEFGQEQQTVIWQAIEPQRSQENWHDDYTPHWIKPGDATTRYTGRRQGWNIIRCAIESGKTVYSFTESVRNSKYYLYPEVNKDIYSKLYDVYESLQTYGHFVANTESPPRLITSEKMQGVVCTAGGITPLLTAYTANLKPGDKVLVLDISPLALTMQQMMRKNKVDYRNFQQSFNEIIKDFADTWLMAMFKADRNINRMQEIINELLPQGLADFIDNVWPHLEIIYVNSSIFDLHAVKRELKYFDSQSNVLIHLSNVLHYQCSAWLYSADTRYQTEMELLKMLYSMGGHRFYLYQNRPGKRKNWHGLNVIEILSNHERYLYQVEQLGILPWKNK